MLKLLLGAVLLAVLYACSKGEDKPPSVVSPKLLVNPEDAASPEENAMNTDGADYVSNSRLKVPKRNVRRYYKKQHFNDTIYILKVG